MVLLTVFFFLALSTAVNIPFTNIRDFQDLRRDTVQRVDAAR
jgi:hypothetical protein